VHLASGRTFDVVGSWATCGAAILDGPNEEGESLTMTTDPEVLERWRRVALMAHERMQRLHLPELDESFWEALRESMLAAGATDREIDGLAAYFVTFVVQSSKPGDELRAEQIELIARHLACADMTVRLGKADSFVSVEFPNRPRIQ
jgi:hypothetical protein